MSAPPPWSAPVFDGPVSAILSLPGSKSLTNRALVLAALADGPSTVQRPLRSRDTELMASALIALSASIDTSGDDWQVDPLTRTRDSGAVRVDCGLAGTVVRFVPPVAALTSSTATFDGDPHLRQRPVGAVIEALRGLGASVEDTTEGAPGAVPFTVAGGGSLRGGRVVIDASASSQFVSALLLAAPGFDEGVDVVHSGPPVPSMPHIEMTIAMLREHGVGVDDSEPDRWRVQPGPVRALDRLVEPDLSNAGAFLGLGAVTAGELTVRDWPRTTTQAGDAMRWILAEMGCDVGFTDDGLRVRGPRRLRGLDADLHDVGELVPVVAALCALADEPSELRGIGHIRGHETDRLAALATELTKLGAGVTEHPDGLSIRPAPMHGASFETYADHRMAHAGALLGARVAGVELTDVGTTAKTFPGFEQVWESLLPVAAG